MFEGLRKPTELIVIVVTLLAYGCPLQAIMHAFGLDERTVASWRDRAGVHCQRVHQDVVETAQLDLQHIYAPATSPLTRKCRQGARRLHPLETGMYLLGTTYNFCWVHQKCV